MSLDWNQGALAVGLACYRRGEFFEAHEHWEDVWRTLTEPEKSFLQAMIQLTAALHHLGSRNSLGAVALMSNALRRLEKCPAQFGGIAVSSLCAEITAWLHAIEDEAPSARAATPQILPATPPSVQF